MSPFQITFAAIFIFILAENSKIIFANTEYDLTCDANHNFLVEKNAKHMQDTCFKEQNIVQGNTTCVIQCLFRKLNLTEDDSGMPSKEKFDKYCDEKVDSKIRNKMKNDVTCFKEHASKVSKNDTSCEGSMDFDKCFETFIHTVCKA